jgi:UDP-N-acetylglucosamine--N-acetylmuramyl-(pentapeptide) pyrophosphoryl-undecaprenol N-acetylglucosamine transferase
MRPVILLTGGGSAGHVTPHLALLPRLQALDLDLHYVGQQAGRSASEPPIEQTLIAPTGLPYHGIDAGKLRRYFDLQNVTDLFRIARALLQSLKLVRRLRPALLFSKGGFVTPPLVWATWLMNHLPPRREHIAIVIHESDMTPGLANRLCLPFADRICYSFPETGQRLPPEKATYTGIPIRASLLNGDPMTGQRLCGFDVADDRPCVLVMGGSQGAAAINQAVHDALEDLLATFNVCHICGPGEALRFKALTLANFKAFSYVTDELPHLYAMADVVVARAGATTLFELLALRKPNLLIPLSLEASRGDQVQNAASFADRGFSHVLAETDLTPATLVQRLKQAYAERGAMVEAMAAAQTVNSVEAVMGVIKEELGMGNDEWGMMNGE